MTLANLTACGTVRLTLELTPNQAAGLARLAEKTDFQKAMEVLYPHVDRDVRANQVHDILNALDQVSKALAEAEVHTWPWIDTGKA